VGSVGKSGLLNLAVAGSRLLSLAVKRHARIGAKENEVMVAVTFDTLEFVETLVEGGVQEPQAKAFAKAVRKSHESAELATKADLQEYESAIRDDLEKLELSLRHEMGDLRHEIGDLRKDMDTKLEKLELRLTIRLGVIIAAAITLAPSISRLLHLST